MDTQAYHYQCDDIHLHGKIARPAGHGPHPVVMVVHAFQGLNAFIEDKICQLAELGYIGFALDMYGEGKRGASFEENMALMAPFIDDRDMIRARMQAGLEAAKRIEGADTTKIAAMGYCFGGMCVLDLARTGVKISAIASFHGVLLSPSVEPSPEIHTPILVLTGRDDPLVPPSQITEFQNEMDAAKADWQIHIYGQAEHAFTFPEPEDRSQIPPGVAYNANADRRSWATLQQFLVEVFS